MYDGFKWPKKWNDNIPEEIRNLERMNGVSGSQEYLPAMIEKIISYMPQGEVASKLKSKAQQKAVVSGTVDFFGKMIRQIGDEACVDMAFHAGNEWRQISNKVDILNYILSHGINLNP